MIVTGIQLNSNPHSKDNLNKVVSFLEKSLSSGPDIIVLPEYSNYMGPLENANPQALSKESVWHRTLSLFARQNNVGIIAGLLLQGKEKRSTSSVVYFDKQGTQKSMYTKLHLFDVKINDSINFCESAYLNPGKQPVIVEIEGIACGVAICYDLRFPELFRYLAVRNIRVIFLPAAFTDKTGKAHWEILVRARAIENQMYMVAVNQVGNYGKDKSSYGKSMIVDPWGKVLAQAPGIEEGSPEGIISASLDFLYQDTIRKNVPCLSHRRRDLFE